MTTTETAQKIRNEWQPIADQLVACPDCIGNVRDFDDPAECPTCAGTRVVDAEA